MVGNNDDLRGADSEYNSWRARGRRGRIGPPPGELFNETNDNSVAILLSYATAYVLLAGDAEAREEEYMVSGSCTRP